MMAFPAVEKFACLTETENKGVNGTGRNKRKASHTRTKQKNDSKQHLRKHFTQYQRHQEGLAISRSPRAFRISQKACLHCLIVPAAVPVNVLSVFDSAKEHHSGKGVTKEQQEHAHYDEEALVHAHHHRQQKHLQSHLHTHTHKHTFCLVLLKDYFTKVLVLIEDNMNFTHMLSTYGEKPQHYHTSAHHVGISILLQKRITQM